MSLISSADKEEPAETLVYEEDYVYTIDSWHGCDGVCNRTNLADQPP